MGDIILAEVGESTLGVPWQEQRGAKRSHTHTPALSFAAEVAAGDIEVYGTAHTQGAALPLQLPHHHQPFTLQLLLQELNIPKL